MLFAGATMELELREYEDERYLHLNITLNQDFFLQHLCERSSRFLNTLFPYVSL